MLQIVTDSSCDLPNELIEKYHIRVVPLLVNIDDEVLREGLDFTPKEFYEKMAKSAKLPKTSQPSPAAFAEVFSELAGSGPILCLTISSKLSGTYQSACLAVELSNTDVTIFDSLTGSLGLGLQVIKACELAEAGKTVSEAMEILELYRKEMKTLIMLNTLENIVKGGRLGKVQGSLANILGIRILLQGLDGDVVLLKKIRGAKKFLDQVLQMIYECCSDMSERAVGITHFNNPADVNTIKHALQERCRAHDFIVNDMGSTMATYAGEGGIIISF